VDCVVWKVERNLLNIEMKENVKIDKEINPKKFIYYASHQLMTSKTAH